MRGVGAQLNKRLSQVTTQPSLSRLHLGQRTAWAQAHGFYTAPQSLGIRFAAIPASKAPDTASIETASVHPEAPAPTLALWRCLFWEDTDLWESMWTTGSGGQKDMDTNS